MLGGLLGRTDGAGIGIISNPMDGTGSVVTLARVIVEQVGAAPTDRPGAKCPPTRLTTSTIRSRTSAARAGSSSGASPRTSSGPWIFSSKGTNPPNVIQARRYSPVPLRCEAGQPFQLLTTEAGLPECRHLRAQRVELLHLRLDRLLGGVEVRREVVDHRLVAGQREESGITAA